MGVAGEEDHGERDVPEEAGAAALVEAEEAELLDDTEGGDPLAASDLSRHLEPDLDNLERVGEHDLAAASTRASQYFSPERDLAVSGHLVPHKIIHGQLDGLLRSNAHQLGHKASI